jgi:glycine/D-amino acid oxidase-like deaminating enzyme
MDRRSLLAILSATAARGFAKNDRVVIVGAGIIGASIAYHLARRGANVTILEKQRPGAGATQNSFAWINSFSKQPRPYYDLNLYGIAGWRRLSLEIGAELQILWGGSVQWASSNDEAERMRNNVGRVEQWGYAAHMIPEAEISKLLPGFAPGPVSAACFADQEGTVDPMQALGTLLKRAQALGAKVEYPCTVTGISVTGQQVRWVETSRGRVDADFLVLAAGVDTPHLAKMVHVDVPLKESPGILAHTAPAERMLDRIALAPGANIKQNPDGRIVTGTDFVGASKIDGSKEFGEKLLDNARRFLPRMKDATLETVTVGYRVLPKDDHPIVGFVEKCPNLYIAAMHSGITLSPLIGQVAAAEILDGVSVDLLELYRPSRFL